MTTDFTVRGSYSAFEPPERGVVHARISLEGPKMQPVFDQVARHVETLRTSLHAIHNPDAGPVTWWSTQQIRTWARRPWHQDGKQLPLVHHAEVGLEAKFRDFSALSRWVSTQIEEMPGFTLDSVRWALTEQRRQQLAREVRRRAVLDASGRAQEYADALNLGPVRPVAIADAGMLGNGLHPSGGAEASFMRASAKAGGGGELELAPADIEVSATVDARFVTS